MRSVVVYINEGRALGYLGAGVTGLGGGLLGGGVGYYQSHKADIIDKEIKRLQGKKIGIDDDKTGLKIAHGIGGLIPGVGLVTNLLAAQKRYDLEDQLNDITDKKSKKKIKKD